jgi:hypothetical protein
MKKHNIRSSFSMYSQSVSNPVDLKTYLTINYMYMKFIIRKVFEGKIVTLPNRLGFFKVLGKLQKPSISEGGIKGLAPDWVKTKELWDRDPKAKEQKKLLYHNNFKTQGVRYRFTWSKNTVLVINKTLYSFRLSRENKRNLSKLIENGKQYIVK